MVAHSPRFEINFENIYVLAGISVDTLCVMFAVLAIESNVVEHLRRKRIRIRIRRY